MALLSLDHWLLEPTPDPPSTHTHVMFPLVSSKIHSKSLENDHTNSSSWWGSALHVLICPSLFEDWCAQLLIPSPCCGCGLPVLACDTNVCVLSCARSAIRYKTPVSCCTSKKEVQSETKNGHQRRRSAIRYKKMFGTRFSLRLEWVAIDSCCTSLIPQKITWTATRINPHYMW